MVNTDILKNNKEVRELCKKILRENQKALEILDGYTDNVTKVMDYAWKYISENIDEMEVLRSSNKAFMFYTPAMANYFIARGSSIVIDDTHVKLRCSADIDGGVKISISMEKLNNTDWDGIQLEIAKRFAPNKKLGGRFFSLNDYCVKLLEESEREVEFEQIKFKIEKRMQQFVTKLRAFEEKLL